MKIPFIGPYPLVRAKEGDAGYDIASSENKRLLGGTSCIVSTGLKVAIPTGCVGRIVSRSGLSFKHNIEVGAGVIDSGYRGEIKIKLYNHGAHAVDINEGDRIAQIVVLRHETPEFYPVESLDKTERGANGFGHTGVKTNSDTFHWNPEGVGI